MPSSKTRHLAVLMFALLASAASAALKPDWKGLVDPFAKSTHASIDDVCTGQTNWSTLEPTDDNFQWSAIDNFLADHPDDKVFIRIFCGRRTPGWLMTRAGSVTQRHTDNDAAGNPNMVEFQCPKWWTTTYKNEYDELIMRLAERYDGNPQVYAITISGGMTYFAEPFMRQLRNGTFNAQQLTDGGLTAALDRSAHESFINSHATHFQDTRSSIAVNPFDVLVTSGTPHFQDSPAESLYLMDYMISTLGSRAIIQNNSIRVKQLSGGAWVNGMGSNYIQLYDRMKQYSQRGYNVGFQLAYAWRVGNVVETLELCEAYRAHFVEINGHFGGTESSLIKLNNSQVTTWDDTFENGDYTGPGNVTNLQSQPGDGKVTLSWTNPGGQSGVRVQRKTGSYPAHPFDGTTVFNAAGSSCESTGLTNGTTYYFKVFAYDAVPNYAAGVTIQGTPTADSLPNPPTGLTATANGATIDLNWNDNNDADLAGYNVYRSQTSGSGYQKVNTGGLIPENQSYYTDTTTMPETTYYYVVRAVDDAGGESGNSNQDSDTTGQADLQTTTVSIGAEDGWIFESTETSGTGGSMESTANGAHALRAGDGSADQQYLSILSFDTSVLPDNATITSAQLQVTRALVVGTNPFTSHGALNVDIKTGTFGAASLELTDFGAAATNSAVASMSSPAADNDPSTGTFNTNGKNAISKTGKTQLRLLFASGDDDDSSTDYMSFYSGENSTSSRRPQLIITYAAGDTTPPSIPGGVSATPGDEQVTVSWSATGGDTAGYRVLRSTVSGSGYTSIGTTANTSLPDTGLTNGTTYYYVVRSYDEVPNESQNSSQVSATPADATAPGVPSGLALSSGDTWVDADWNDATGDVAGYNLHRSTVSGSGFELLATVTSSDYLDKDTENGITYYYQVSSFDEVPNESAQCSQVSIQAYDDTAPIAPTGLAATAGTNEVSLTWQHDLYTDAEGFQVWRSTVSGSGFSLINGDETTTDTLYLDTTVTSGNTYYYKVRAYDEVPNYSNYSSEASATVGLATDLISVGADDGWIFESDENSSTGGSLDSTANGSHAIRMGDGSADQQYVSLVSFDTSTLPAQAVVTGARLYLTCAGLSGGYAFDTHGLLYGDVKNGTFNNAALELTDFYGGATASEAVTMSTVEGDGDVSSGDLNSAGVAAVNKTGKTQIRLRFSLQDDDDNASDYMRFYSGENSTASRRPKLTVFYYLDTVSPGAVTALNATADPAGNKVNLTWSNPTDADFLVTVIRRKTGSYPTGPTDGTSVYSGVGTSTSDTGLTDGTTYYYAAWAQDVATNYSATAAQDTCVPADTTAPGPVTGFNATPDPAGNKIDLSWTNPGTDLAGIRILRRTNAYPSGWDDSG